MTFPWGQWEPELGCKTSSLLPTPTHHYSPRPWRTVSSLSEKKKKKKKKLGERNSYFKSSSGREEVGRPQHPPPLPLTSPSRGTLFPSSHPRSFPRQGSPLAAPDLADVSKSWATRQEGRRKGLTSPFTGRGDEGVGSWGGRLKEGNPERRRCYKNLGV